MKNLDHWGPRGVPFEDCSGTRMRRGFGLGISRIWGLGVELTG